MEESKIVIIGEDGKEDKKATRKMRIKSFAETAWKKTVQVTKDAYTFVVNNKENVTFVVTGVVAGVTALRKLKPTRQDDYREYVDSSVYDYVSHRRFYLKRPMRNHETIEYLERLKYGEPAYEILRDMRLLRR